MTQKKFNRYVYKGKEYPSVRGVWIDYKDKADCCYPIFMRRYKKYNKFSLAINPPTNNDKIRHKKVLKNIEKRDRFFLYEFKIGLLT